MLISQRRRPSVGDGRIRPHRPIELQIRKIEQLFHTLDPTPYHERDLDADVEAYVIAWARELPPRRPLQVVIHLPAEETAREEAAHVGEALRNYFAYQADMTGLELKELFRVGRVSLIIGLMVLAACSVAARLISREFAPGYLGPLFAEGLLILGWVANWRPIEIILYDWWPIVRRRSLYRRLSDAEIILRHDRHAATVQRLTPIKGRSIADG